MTCDHNLPKQWLHGRNRCPECYRAANRARAARRRERDRLGITPGSSTLRCPECALFPCRCEAL